MAIVLTPDTENRLHEEAARTGQDVEEFVSSLLDAVAAASADADLTPDNIAELRAGIERGLTQGKEGHVTPATTVYARLNALHNSIA